ncbi:hypothetical protein V1512DRAFT_213611 [Lipomyces arxii]|uniref:uncharacterized protein n=1 Tax=Lipomyces arxii TaxID=56418 RepID=UPI0034CD0BC1
MSVEWRWGAVCGINNCLSRLWHTVDGLSYCQYGHQNEGAVEIVADDDEFQGTQGRTIRTKDSQNTVVKETQVYYGRQGYVLFLQCYQAYLWALSEWLVQNRDAPERLIETVKALWVLYLDARGVERLNLDIEQDEPPESPPATPDAMQLIENATKDDTDDEPVQQAVSDHEEDDESETAKQLADLNLSQRAGGAFIHISLHDSIALLYIACRLISMPIFLCDFYSWVDDGEMPYLRASQIVPYSLRMHLAPLYSEIFEPTVRPALGIFYRASTTVINLLQARFNLVIPSPPVPLLLSKFCRALLLPDELHVPITRLLNRLQLNKLTHPDIEILAAVIVTVKIRFGLAENASQQIDEWCAALQRRWISVGDSDVAFWDDAKVDKFLHMYERMYVVRDEEEAKTALASSRFLNFFPLISSDYIEPPQDVDQIDSKRLTENLKQVDGRSFAGQYQIRNVYRELPAEVIEPNSVIILLEAASSMAGCSVLQLRRCIKRFELQCMHIRE